MSIFTKFFTISLLIINSNAVQESKITKVDYHVVRSTIETIIDTALGTDEKSATIQSEIAQYKKKCASRIIRKLKFHLFKDHYQIIEKAFDLTYADLIKHIGECTNVYVHKTLSDNDNQNLNRQFVKDEIKNMFVEQAKEQLKANKNKYCSLCPLYADALNQKVTAKITELLAAREECYQPAEAKTDKPF